MKTIALVLFVMLDFVLAAQVKESKVAACARGWLNAHNGVLFGQEGVSVGEVTSCHDGRFYAVNLVPEGFLIINCDDTREPVIAYSATASFDVNSPSPLNELLHGTSHVFEDDNVAESDAVRNQNKWGVLATFSKGRIMPMEAGLAGVSDVCVSPLTQTQWNQLEVCSKPAYNLYTPDNYPAGCVATAMAQLMRFHEYPCFPIGTQSLSIGIDGFLTSARLRGGDGAGSAYDWSLMDLVPDCESTQQSLEQIGALCHDAGLSVNMVYSAAASNTETYLAGKALRETFGYAQANAIYKASCESALVAVNSNLNAGMPVILGLSTAEDVEQSMGHSVVCDGYGYDLGTVYHHINMGWGGIDNLWYSFPEMDVLSVVEDVVYNVSPAVFGGIISGRVTMPGAGAVEGALITTGAYSTYTNANGIYAFIGLPEGVYSLKARFPGFDDCTVQAEIETNDEIWRNTCDTDFVLGQAPFTVVFYAGQHGRIAVGDSKLFVTQQIYNGDSAVAPVVTPDYGWRFIGWNAPFSSITANRSVTALYSDQPYHGDGFETYATGSDYFGLIGFEGWELSEQQANSGLCSIRSGFIGDGEQSTIMVNVSDAVEVSFSYKVSGEEAYDCLRFSIDDKEVGVWSGITGWNRVSFPLPTIGTHRLTWGYTKDFSFSMGDDCAWIDDIELVTDYQSYTVTFMPGEHGAITGGEAVQKVVEGREATAPSVTAQEGWHFTGWDVDYSAVLADTIVTACYSSLPYTADDFELSAISDFYTCSGAGPWIISGEAHQGSYSMRSGEIRSSRESSIELTVENVAGVTFWKKVSSEEYYDFLSFYVDGVLMERWSGVEDDWSEVYFPLTVSKAHILKWTYVKDGSATAGEDCAWVDDISLETEFESCVATFLPGPHGAITGGEAVQTIVVGRTPVPPVVTAEEGWSFVGWEADYFNLTRDTEITAKYCDEPFNGDRFERRAISDFFTCSGDAPWVLANSGCLSGYSVCSGDITDLQTSSIEVTVENAERVDFMLYVSTEEYCDFLTFCIDDVEQGYWSGVVNEWRRSSFALDPSTSHVLKWTYSKDLTISEGLDCVFVDDILLTSSIPLFPDANADGIVNQTDIIMFCEYWLRLTFEIPCEDHSVDFNRNGKVDMDDFAVLSEYWLENK